MTSVPNGHGKIGNRLASGHTNCDQVRFELVPATMHIERFFFPCRRALSSSSGQSIRQADELELEPLPTEDGLLVDPDGDSILTLTRNSKRICRWMTLDDLKCVVMLGEPGRGKSNEWKYQVEQVNERFQSRRAFLILLNRISSEDDLRNALAPLREHLSGSAEHTADVFFDSVDEGMLYWSQLDRHLIQACKDLLARPVCLRFSSRPADWPPSLERYLSDTFGEPSADPNAHAQSAHQENDWTSTDHEVGQAEFETLLSPESPSQAVLGQPVQGLIAIRNEWACVALCPLREVDVRALAHDRGVHDVDAFIERLRTSEALAFAADPVSLFGIINTYGSGSPLPHSRAELYEELIKQLLHESSSSRNDAARFDAGLLRDRDHVDLPQRIAVAERVAALCVFCRRRAVNIQRNDNDGHILSRIELEGERVVRGDSATDPHIAITRDAVQAILDTPLFASTGPDTFSFAHWSYAEFLAARAVRSWTNRRLHSLFAHPDDARRRVVPPLHETAAWLASSNTAFRDELLETGQCLILLSADPAALDSPTRAQLVREFFELVRSPELNADELDSVRVARRIGHPGLPDQLRKHILGRTTPRQRRLAFELAAQQCADQLAEDLIAIALDAQQPHQSRCWALMVLEHSRADAVTLRRLLPLASLAPNDRDNSSLKGHALSLLFPRVMNIAELVQALDRIDLAQRLDSAYLDCGFYLSYILPDRVADGDGAIIGQWLVSALQGSSDRTHLRFGRLVAGIFYLNWSRSADPSSAAICAELIIQLARLHTDLWSDARGIIEGANTLEMRFKREFAQDSARRRTLIEQHLRRLPAALPQRLGFLVHDHDSARVLGCKALLVEDAEWLLGIVGSLPLVGRAFVYAACEQWMIDGHFKGSALSDAFIVAVERDVESAGFRRLHVEAWPINCKERGDYRRQLNRASRRAQGEPRPPLWPTVEPLLSNVTAGEPLACSQLAWNLCLRFEQGNGWIADQFRWSHVNETWSSLSDEQQQRILNAIESAIKTSIPTSHSCFEADLPTKWCAWLMRWLVVQRPESSVLDGESLVRWLPFAIHHFMDREQGQFIELMCNKKRPELSKATVQLVREWLNSRVSNSVEEQLDTPSPAPCTHFALDLRIRDCCKEQIGQAALDALSSTALIPDAEAWCLDATVRAGTKGLDRWLVENTDSQVLCTPDSSNHRVHTRRFAALMQVAPAEAWLLANQVAQGNQAALRPLFSSLADSRELADQIFGKLLVADTANALAIMAPIALGASPSIHPHSEEYTVVVLWNAGIRRLMDLAGPDALAAIDDLSVRFPQYESIWLHHRGELDCAWLRGGWNGRRPSDLHRMLLNQQARVIASDAELFDVVCDLLDEVQQRLLGDATVVPLLWSDGPCRKPRPESDLQMVIKNQLVLLAESWGLSTEREVRIGANGNSDLRISAKTANGEVVRVVGEIKNENHRNVSTAMSSQLVDGYMREGDTRYGVYLIGHYQPRSARGRRQSSLAVLRKRFDRQAAKLRSRNQDVAKGLEAFVFDLRLHDSPSSRATASVRSSKTARYRKRSTGREPAVLNRSRAKRKRPTPKRMRRTNR